MTRFATHLSLALAFVTPAALQAETIFGLTAGNSIVTFDSASPTTIMAARAITGLSQGDILTGIDFRPANQQLYSLATNGRLYVLTSNASTFTASLVGITTTPSGSVFGIDFNPMADRLRLVSDTNQNLRINPADGSTTVDTAITLNGSSTVDLVAAAYTNSVPAAASTMLYGIDTVSDSLLLSSNPNGGLYGTVGALGINVTNSNAIGFDISGVTGIGYVNVDSAFYRINLGTGALTFVNTIGAGPLVGISAAPVPEPASWAMMIAGFGMVGRALRGARQIAMA